MKNVVLALGISLSALSLAACEAQQEAPVAEETEVAVPAVIEDIAPVATDTTGGETGEAPATTPNADATEMATPAVGETAPAQ